MEVARFPQTIALRDSKNPHGPKLVVGRDEFAALLATLKR
ncbi:DUF397 domain-containing protein [Actinomadura latina]|nr:DUF397 domain-containing protein [Actinomadura latina]